MNSTARLLWQRSPVKILSAVSLLLLGLGHFEYAAHRIKSEPLMVSINTQARDFGGVNRNNIRQEVFAGESAVRDVTDFQERLSLEDPQQIEKEWTAWKVLHPEEAASADAAFFDVFLLMKKDGPASALDLLESMAEDRRQTARYYLYLGIMTSAAGRTLDALGAYQKALALRPNYFEAAYNLGVLFFNTGRQSEAETYLRRAVGYAGGIKKAAAYRVLGKSLMAAGRFEEAQGVLNESILLEPAAVSARLALAELLGQNLGRSDEARAVYGEVLRLDSNVPEVYLGLAELELKEGDRDQAVVVLSDALPLFPDSGTLRLELAKIYIDLGEQRTALGQLDLIAESDPQYANVLFQRGRIYFQQNKNAAAEEMFRQAWESSEHPFVEAMNNLGLVFSSQEKLPEAVEAYETAIAAAPWYDRAWYNLGVTRLSMEEYDAAEAAFAKALEINDGYQEAWYNLGVTEGLRGNLNASVDAYHQALALNPEDIKSRLNLAVQYRKLGDEPSALEEYLLVLKLNPEYTTAWFNLALLQRNLGNPDEAEKAYRRALALEPEQHVYWMNLSALLSSRNRVEEARDLLLEAVEINPDAEELHFNLALQYEKLGDFSPAVEQYEIAVSLNPAYGKGWKELGSLLSDLDRHFEALNAFTRAYSADEDPDPYLRYLAGKELYVLGRYPEALDYMNAALESIQDNEFIWYNTGKVYQALGNYARAEESYSMALNIDPGIGRLMEDELAMLDESDEIYLQRIEDDPNNPVWPSQLAALMYSQGRREDALEILHEAVLKFPGNADVLSSLGKIYADGDEWDEAEKYLRQAAGYQPDDPDISLDLAGVLQKLERFDDAESIYRTVIANQQEALAAQRDLAEMFYDLQKFPESAELLEQVVKARPEYGSAWMDLGKAYYRNKEYEKAGEPFARSLETMPDYPWAYVWYGRALRKMEEYDHAEELFRSALSLDPKFTQGYIALGDLYRELKRDALARDTYESALELDPVSSSIRRRIASVSP